MPLPLIPIAIGAAVLSVGSTVHSTLKTRKWQKLHNEALAGAQETEQRTRNVLNIFNREAQSLGKLRVEELATLKRAADFLKNAKIKDRNLKPQLANIPTAQIDRWQKLHGEAVKSLGIGTLGTAGAAGAGMATAAGLYTAAGIFGTASTGTAIAGLSGAAAHSARLAWLGGGALTAGGAGMAGGLAMMMTAANVVMTPVAIAAAAWGQWKAHKVQQEVEKKLKEFAAFETKMQRKETLLKTALLRIAENRQAIQRAVGSLKTELSTAKPQNQQSAYAVYLKAKALSECLDAPVMTQSQMRELNS